MKLWKRIKSKTKVPTTYLTVRVECSFDGEAQREKVLKLMKEIETYCTTELPDKI